MMEMQFWIGLAQIVSIDILLGGDNAVVIALACRDLPEKQRGKAMAWGVIGAVVIRLTLIFFALALLRIPYIRIVAALLLFWIGVNLLGARGREDGNEIKGSGSLAAAIRTIIVADAVMSIDNIIGVAGAARDNMLLIVLGISISVPVILWGSRQVLKMMDRFPALITMGAALIGWIAGDMMVMDTGLREWVQANFPALSWASPVMFALATVLIGKWRASRQTKVLVDLTEPGFGKDAR